MAESGDLIGRRGVLIGGLWNAAQMVIPMLATLALSVVIGRSLGPDDLGVQSFIAFVESMLAGVLILSLCSATIQVIASAKGARDERAVESLAYWSMRLQIINGLVAGCVLLVASAFSTQPLLWGLAAATALFNAAGWAYSSRVIGWSGTWQLVASRRIYFQVVAQLVSAVGVLLGYGLVTIFAVNLVSAALLVPVLLRQSRRAGVPKAVRSGPIPAPLRTLWWQFMLRNGLMQVVGQRIEYLFLAAYTTPDQIAYYSIAFMLVNAGVTIPISVLNSALAGISAQAASGNLAQVHAHLANAARVSLSGGVILAAGIASFGPPLVTALYGPEFAGVGPLVLWMAPLAIILPVSEVIETYWGSMANLRLVLWSALVGALVDVALCLLLIPKYQALGAAVANTLGQSTLALLVISLSWRRIGRPDLLPRKAVLGGAWMLLVTVAVTAVIQGLGTGMVGMLAGAALFSVGLLGYGTTVGFLRRDDRTWLGESLPGPLGRFLPLIGGIHR